MNRLTVNFLDEGFHRVLFDAMPLPIFIVDGNINIFDCNKAATQLIGKNSRLVIRRRGGEVLGCVNAAKLRNGCGRTPACRDCMVRQSVSAAARGRRVARQWAQMELVRRGKVTRVKLRVSCQQFSFGKSDFILLVLEGLN
ncbi:MAG: PAS domain-containing protein [Verrucomicrobiota bacterium]|jgi:PAS domain-containing protein